MGVYFEDWKANARDKGLTQTLYDRLIRVLDAYIDEYGGRLRLRGVLTALLVLRQSLNGDGISISDVSRKAEIPLENVRRHFGNYANEGILTSRADPNDERVTRYFFLDVGAERGRATRVAQALYEIGPPAGGWTPHPENAHPFSEATCDALTDALKAFTGTLDSGLRMRAFKIAIALHQASLSSEGMTTSQIARISGAPLETVRRTLKRYLELGNLRVVEDPDDDRAHRVLYRDPDWSGANIAAMAERLGKLDWSLLNVR